jgi:hypothetical protein
LLIEKRLEGMVGFVIDNTVMASIRNV